MLRHGICNVVGPVERSDSLQGSVSRWSGDRRGRANLNAAAVHHHGHRTAVNTALVAFQESGLKPGLEFVELPARVAATSDGEDHILAKLDDGSNSECRHVDTVDCDVLAELARPDLEAVSTQPTQQSRIDQMHLPEIRPADVLGETAPVLHRRAAVGVPLDTGPSDERRAFHSML